MDDFAYAFPEIRSLESLLSGLSDSDLSDMGSTDQFHGVQAARIRKALRFAHDLCQQPTEPSQQVNQPPSLPAAILPQASPASWVENLPPKLSQEAQLLASALYDDNLRLAASWLSRIQTVYRNAWALCGAAHLNNLKAFDKRVMDLALPDLADNSLRGPTTQELLAADRKIWGTIRSLVSAGWSLDEALYEVTSIRSDLSNLLQ